jgi:thiamine-monophosphate kinase
VEVDIAISLIASKSYYTRAGGQFEPKPTLTDWHRWALAGGDDYELLFSAPPSARGEVAAAAQASQTPVTRIGRIDAKPGLRLLDGQGQLLTNRYTSFDHFR